MGYLILTRRIGEELLIGDDVRVTVMGMKGSQVRLAIQAPPTIAVDRKEIRERKARESNIKETSSC